MVEEARRFAPAVPGSLTSTKESRVLRDWHDHTVACVTDCATSVGGINTRMRTSHRLSEGRAHHYCTRFYCSTSGVRCDVPIDRTRE